MKNQIFCTFLIIVLLVNCSFLNYGEIMLTGESKENNNEPHVNNDNERIVELKVNNENPESVSIKNLEELKNNVLEEINSFSYEYNSKDPSSLSPKNAFAIVVGIEDYPGTLNDLDYCVDDANSIKSYLENTCNFKSSNIISLTNSLATRSDIITAFNQISSFDKTDDLFLFYFSGHGGTNALNDEYICPYDSLTDPNHRIYDDDLNSFLNLIDCSEKYVVIDACESGGMIPESQDSGRYFMTACDAYEYSYETDQLNHGVFTYYFLRSPNYAADSDGNGVISIEEQYDYTAPRTTSYVSNYIEDDQYPQEFDGISGPAVLYPSIGSLTFNPLGNQLDYSFYLYGHGEIFLLNLTLCSVVNEIVVNSIDLTGDSVTNTGFESYSGTKNLDPEETVTGYEIVAQIWGDTLKIIKKTFGDYDGDGLYDLFEIFEGNGIDPRLNDTDSDFLNDYDEYYGVTNPLINDTDSDYVLDGIEVYTYGSNPLINDTDSDGLLDGDEVYNHSTSPILVDTDGDGLNDSSEINMYFTNATLYDTDGDGLNDKLEIKTYFTNATLYDTDGDGYSDGWEVTNGYNPLDSNDFPKNPTKVDDKDDNTSKKSGIEFRIDWGLLTMAIIGIVSFIAVKTYKKRKSKASTKREYSADKFRKSEQTNRFISDLKICKNCGKTNSRDATTCIYCKASLPINLGDSSESLSRNASEKNLNNTKAIIKDFITNKLPPPKSQFSPENREALLMGVMANKKLSEGNILESIYLMLTALKLGIPEPMNSEIRSFLSDSLDNDFQGINLVNFPSFFGILKCKKCGNNNEPTSKVCTKCGSTL